VGDPLSSTVRPFEMAPLFFFSFSSFFFFWQQGLALTRQVFYLLSHTTAPCPHYSNSIFYKVFWAQLSCGLELAISQASLGPFSENDI
jgi:hypothetical protein